MLTFKYFFFHRLRKGKASAPASAGLPVVFRPSLPPQHHPQPMFHVTALPPGLQRVEEQEAVQEVPQEQGTECKARGSANILNTSPNNNKSPNKHKCCCTSTHRSAALGLRDSVLNPG